MRQEDRYIYQVYCEGSFSKAAQKLFVTQPALSLAIQRVEQQIEMPLFDRSSRPLALTAAGQAYIDTIEKEMRLEQDLQRQLKDIRDRNTGSLRLGGSHYINAYILPEILAGFQAEYPGIQIALQENDSAELAHMLTEKELDLTFSCNTSFIEAFDHFPAFYDHILLAIPECREINTTLQDCVLTSADVVSGRHLSEDCPTVPLIHFQEESFILLKAGNNLHDRCHQMFRDAGFEPKVKMNLSQLVTACRLAEHQIGATFISDRLVTGRETGLCYYKLSHKLADRLFYLLMPKNMYVSYATRTFAAYVRQYMSQNY